MYYMLTHYLVYYMTLTSGDKLPLLQCLT